MYNNLYNKSHIFFNSSGIEIIVTTFCKCHLVGLIDCTQYLMYDNVLSLQVEYSYPPLIAGGEVDSHEVPPEWKNLPSLAVPDGAHNYIKGKVIVN